MDLAHGWSTAPDDGSEEREPESSMLEGADRGLFSYDIGTDTWWWSEGTYRIHGFEPGDVVPTTRLVLAHKHPDDRERFWLVLLEACRTGEPFVSVHRIMAATGETRQVVLAGQARVGPRGTVLGLTGSFMDVTRLIAGAAARLADEQIRGAGESRATIEQAKGILGAAWKVPPEAAFERLRQISMDRNVPVRSLAEQVVCRACAAPDSSGRRLSLLD